MLFLTREFLALKQQAYDPCNHLSSNLVLRSRDVRDKLINRTHSTLSQVVRSGFLFFSSIIQYLTVATI